MSDAGTTIAPPASTVGVAGWLRANLFGSASNTALTLLGLYVVLSIIGPIYDWAVAKALWSVPDSRTCREGEGACWAFLREKARFILFGTYPFDQQWRPVVACAMIVALLLASCNRRFWNSALMLWWTAGSVATGILMWGGVLGLSPVENSRWGGLPLTLILSVIGIVFCFPLAILLALGRRSHMPAIRAIAVAYIELVRGVPLISVLFMASVMFPLFLPEGVTIDKLLRAQVAIILFAAAYLSEAVRGGLQAIPRGQFEAADALGLSYGQKMRKIVLPQALRLVIPPMVNTFISTFKDTSLVIIIGLFDLMQTANVSITDPAWRGFYFEAYLFIAAIYFGFCFFMSRYSQYLESQFSVGAKR